MTDPVMVKITLKNEDKNVIYSYLEYRRMEASANDPILKDLIQKSIEDFQDEIDDIKIKLDILVD